MGRALGAAIDAFRGAQVAKAGISIATSGGRQIGSMKIIRIYGHTYPYGIPGNQSASPEDIQALQSLGQRSSYISADGNLFKFSVGNQ